uniref:Uncharacterized protein n=1 Tax=Melopsittacus undulatus TaxID=13146 RepID=A0A8V5GQL5_MELUD
MATNVIHASTAVRPHPHPPPPCPPPAPPIEPHGPSCPFSPHWGHRRSCPPPAQQTRTPVPPGERRCPHCPPHFGVTPMPPTPPLCPHSPMELRQRLALAEAQDKAAVQAQVTSLLLELKESQELLESGRRERQDLEQRAQAAHSRCRALEAAASGHTLQMDQLRLQVQNLETALRVERQRASDEKRKLVQLQAAYHHLFQEYDAHIKASLEGDRRSQVRPAPEALAAKQERIDRLEAEAQAQRAQLETIPVLQAQADIFKADFAAERAAREQLHAQREALQEELEQLRRRLEAEGAARDPKSSKTDPKSPEIDPKPTPNNQRLTPNHPPHRIRLGGPPPEEEPELCCPKCLYKAPDMDTLQIHVMDCIK